MKLPLLNVAKSPNSEGRNMDSWIISTLGSMKWDVKDFSPYFVVTAPFGHYIAFVPKDDKPDEMTAVCVGMFQPAFGIE